MNDVKIIDMYYKGFSINYISKCYSRYKNRNTKLIELDAMKLFPIERYTLSDAKVYVHKVIYNNIINNSML